MNQIVQRINLGHINELHFTILEIVNEFEFITSRQILQMLEKKGIKINIQKLEEKIGTKGIFFRRTQETNSKICKTSWHSHGKDRGCHSGYYQYIDTAQSLCAIDPVPGEGAGRGCV